MDKRSMSQLQKGNTPHAMIGMDRVLLSSELAIKLINLLLLTCGTISGFVQLLPVSPAVLYTLSLLLLSFCVLANLLINRRVDVSIIFFLMSLRTFLFLVLWLINDDYGEYFLPAADILTCLALFVLLQTDTTINVPNVIRSTTSAALIIGSIETIVAFYIAWIQSGSFFGIKNLIQIPWGSSNYISCILLINLAMFFATEESVKSRTLITVLSITAILMTRSTSGIVGLVLIVLFYTVVSGSRRYAKPAAIFGLIMLFAALVVNQINSKFFDRFSAVLSKALSGDVSSALNGRDLLFEDCYRIFLSNPLFGVGPHYRAIVSGNTLAHNVVMDELCRNGILGLFLLVMLAVCFLRRLLIYRETCVVAQGSLCVLLLAIVLAMVEPCIHTFVFDFYLIMFLSAGLVEGRR